MVVDANVMQFEIASSTSLTQLLAGQRATLLNSVKFVHLPPVLPKELP